MRLFFLLAFLLLAPCEGAELFYITDSKNDLYTGQWMIDESVDLPHTFYEPFYDGYIYTVRYSDVVSSGVSFKVAFGVQSVFFDGVDPVWGSTQRCFVVFDSDAQKDAFDVKFVPSFYSSAPFTLRRVGEKVTLAFVMLKALGLVESGGDHGGSGVSEEILIEISTYLYLIFVGVGLGLGCLFFIAYMQR